MHENTNVNDTINATNMDFASGTILYIFPQNRYVALITGWRETINIILGFTFTKALILQGFIDACSSVLTTIFSMKLVYELPPMLIMSLPYCQTMIPMIIFAFVQKSGHALPRIRGIDGLSTSSYFDLSQKGMKCFGKFVFYIIRGIGILLLLVALIPPVYFVYLKYVRSPDESEFYWMIAFVLFIIISSGTHWINYSQLSCRWIKEFFPTPERSCNTAFGTGVLLSIIKIVGIVATFFVLDHSDWAYNDWMEMKDSLQYGEDLSYEFQDDLISHIQSRIKKLTVIYCFTLLLQNFVFVLAVRLQLQYLCYSLAGLLGPVLAFMMVFHFKIQAEYYI